MSRVFSRQWLAPLLGVFVAIVLASCASGPDDNNGQPVQSPSDNLQYRLLTLDNQMEVLLVSDPDTPKAAAALDVLVGSGDNPDGRGGLAHFLEHMLFLGTDKYPDAAEYEEFITEHGGSRNAYTSFEHTNYFFDINQAYLPEALDRFAQFFIAPKFDAQYVDREKNAVQAEYQMGLKSDPRRGLDVLQQVMNPEHPFSQFSVGSLDSLADRPGSTVRDELLSFYDKHYSANMMRLVVLGSESLDELEAMVVPMFTPVPNKSYSHPPIEQPIFTPESLPMLVQVKPQATMRGLQVSFPVADYREAYHEKPLGYLGNLVGHEGEGSLLSTLKAQGLAESLSAGSGLAWRGGSLFSIDVTLTQQGVAEYERVLQLLFAYMDMLRERGPQEWLYDEQSQLAQLSFRFRESGEPIGYVSALATGMHYYAPRDVLQGPYIMDSYESDQLIELMAGLTRDNALVVLSDAGVQTDLVSTYYEVPYSQQTVTGEQLASWQLQGDAGQALDLPAPNQFIAEDVSLVKIAKDNPAVPEVALEQGRQKIWFVQDEEFRLPRGATYINFRSPLVGQSVEQSAAAVLYTALLKDELNEYTYPALLAGLNFSLYKHAQGISLRIGGYNDKQAVLLAQILDAIARSSFTSARFESIREDMVRSLQNSVAKRPSSQVMDDLRESVLYGEWGEAASIAALEQMTLEKLTDYSRDFWASASAESLLYGNYKPSAVKDLAGMIDRVLQGDSNVVLPELKVLKLAADESVQYPVAVQHDDSVVAWYLQAESNQWSDRAATALTAQIMKSGFFQQLRTEQQLGYIAASFAWPQLDVPGLVMLIQSPVADADAVASAMQAFMLGLEASIDEAQFARHQAALAAEIRKPEKNLWERAEYYWQSIAKKHWQFDSRENLAKEVEALTRDSWLAYYNRVFVEQRHSLQVVSPGRWGKLPAGQARREKSAEAIKSGHDAYVID